MQIWCIANQKGGVGKTTTVAGLAGAFAASGARVLMVDLDPHVSLSHWFGVDPAAGIAGSVELYAPSPTPIRTLARDTADARIALLPGHHALATLERDSAGRAGLGRALVQAFASDPLDVDHVLLDCPPTLGVLMVSALAAADHLVVPTQTEPLALRALDGMLRTAAMIERSRARALPVSVAPTLFDRRTRVAQDSIAELRARPACAVWHEEIPVDTRLREASRRGVTPATFDARSRGAVAFVRLAAWLLERAHGFQSTPPIPAEARAA